MIFMTLLQQLYAKKISTYKRESQKEIKRKNLRTTAINLKPVRDRTRAAFDWNQAKLGTRSITAITGSLML